MFLLFSKRRICPTIHIPILNYPRQIHPLLPRPLFSSESATQNPYPQTHHFVVADYLIANFGFSTDKAAKASKRIAHLSSPEKPDSVRRLLNDKGFSVADVNRLVTWCPELLSSSPGKTLDPNFRALSDMGLSTSAINQIILSNPNALLCGNEPAVVKAFTRNRGLVNHDNSSSIAPKISLLQTRGLSNQNIGRIVSTIPWLITGRTSGMEDILKRTEELGIKPGSGMFVKGLYTITNATRAALKNKMDLLKSFGWSDDDFSSAVRSAPLMVLLSVENLRTTMDFLLGEAKCAPSYIVRHPILLTYSLEKRLRPRNNVLHLLETRGLSVKGRGFLYAIKLNNNQFVERYIIPHKEEITGLHETYHTDCG